MFPAGETLFAPARFIPSQIQKKNSSISASSARMRKVPSPTVPAVFTGTSRRSCLSFQIFSVPTAVFGWTGARTGQV